MPELARCLFCAEPERNRYPFLEDCDGYDDEQSEDA
jgi:hypothetical protein